MEILEKKYTEEDLNKNAKRYSENFDKLCKTVGTPQHKKYVCKERKLNRLDEQIRRDLGIYIPDPCPLTVSKDCRVCSGYYERENKKTIETEVGIGNLCFLKKVTGDNLCPLKMI